MLGITFYHGLVKKYVIIFGSLFNDITIERVDSDDVAVKSMKIPLAYGPKERYLARQLQNEDLQRPVSMVYPRMAFEITNFRYDSSRKLNSRDKCTTGSSSAGTLVVQYNPVPYNIDFRLSIIARNSDDALRIVEQILPFFNPVLTVSAKLIPEMDYEASKIPIILNSVKEEELYEDGFTSKEYVIWTLDFTMKAQLYGPTSTSKIIKEVTVNFEIPEGDITATTMAAAEVQEHVYVRPGLDANGNPTVLLANSVALANISSTDAYGFITTFVSDFQGE